MTHQAISSSGKQNPFEEDTFGHDVAEDLLSMESNDLPKEMGDVHAFIDDMYRNGIRTSTHEILVKALENKLVANKKYQESLQGLDSYTQQGMSEANANALDVNTQIAQEGIFEDKKAESELYKAIETIRRDFGEAAEIDALRNNLSNK